MRLRAVAPLLFLLAALAAAAQDGTPAATVHSFFSAWGQGDTSAAAAYWIDPASPDFHRHVRRVLAVNCLTLHEARITGVQLTDDRHAEVDVELRLTRQNAMAGAPVHHELAAVRLRLQRIGETWRIERWREREEQLVDELLLASDKSDWLDARANEWTPALVRVLIARAVDFINRDDDPLGRELIALATRVATALDDDVAKSRALAAASILERKKAQPDYPASVAIAGEALAFAERSGDPDAIAHALVRLGRAQSPEPHVEGPPFQRALAMADFLEDQTVAGQAASQLAMYHEFRGEFRLALIHAGMAERFGREAGHVATMLSTEMNLAGLFNRLGDPELSAMHYDRAAAIARRNGFNRIYASFVNVIVAVRHQLGTPPEELIPLLDEALALPLVRENPTVVSDLYCTRSTLYRDLRQFDEAENDLLEALSAIHSGIAYIFLADLRYDQGRYAEARAAAEVAGLDPRGIPAYVAALRDTGELDAALAMLRCANEWGEKTLEALPPHDRMRQIFLASQYDVDRMIVDLLVQRGDHLEALAAAEEAKGRVMLEAAARARGRADVHAPESGRDRELKARVEHLNRALLTETSGTRHDALRTELDRARLELEESQTRDAARIREHASDAGMPIGRLSEWPFDGLTAIEYVIGERNTILFVARPGAAGRMRLDVHVVPADRHEIARLVARLRERIAARDLRYREPARQLYDLLLAPVEPFLASGKSLCIMPDGDLWKVPFQVLMNERGTALVERMPVFYAASIRMLHAVARNTTPKHAPRLLALGNPSIGATTAAKFRAYERSTLLGDLRDAEEEVQRIASLYGRDRSAVHVRGEAREALFKEKARDFDILHIASHGLVDDAAPMFSALVLAAAQDDAEDGLLEAHEVAELHLDADLVVLSACDTASGKIGGGEGILGLTWAFLAAGSRGLVGSQWKAPSAATEALMVAFHERLLAGDSPAAALRQAQLRLMRDERYETPLDWAPFIVVGNGLR